MQGTLWSTWGSIEKTSFRAEDIINWFPHLHSKDLLHKTFGPSNWDKKINKSDRFFFLSLLIVQQKIETNFGQHKIYLGSRNYQLNLLQTIIEDYIVAKLKKLKHRTWSQNVGQMLKHTNADKGIIPLWHLMIFPLIYSQHMFVKHQTAVFFQWSDLRRIRYSCKNI